MKQQQLQNIIQSYINFEIVTPRYRSPRLSEDKIEFQKEGLIKIKQDSQTDVYIETKNILHVIGVGRV